MAEGGSDTRDRRDANENLAQTKSGRADDLKIMNLVILIDSAQMFFRNFGLRHAGAAFGDFAIELARPKAGRVIMAISQGLLNGCDRGFVRRFRKSP
jgi:hypothetical protein